MDKKFGADIPMGLGMALMQNEEAYLRFISLNESQRRQIVDGTKGISSKEEMRNYVSGISTVL